MDISRWRARCAAFIDRQRTGAAGFRHSAHAFAAARRSLSGWLSPHLMRDIGLSEGNPDDG